MLSRPAGRPKDLTKRAAILRAAADLFTNQGFAQSSMDQVAQTAGVSKLTVYNHFGTKEQLFDAVVSCKCDEHFGGRDFSRFAGMGAEAGLREIGTRFIQLLFSEDVVRMHRMLIASAVSHPDLCERFYAAGPAQALASMTTLLEVYIRRGELRMTDPVRAADQFFALFHGQVHWRILLGLVKTPSKRELQFLLDSAVGMFLVAYRPLSRAPD